MRLLGFDIQRNKKSLAPVGAVRGGWYSVLESYAGAWQQNVKVNRDTVLSNPANFACKTLIASDIAKLRVKFVKQDDNGIWTEGTNAAFSPVLRKPNGYQNRIQFWENWMLSKLSYGNTYVLKERNHRGGTNAGNVVALYVLDPKLVTPMVSDDGQVFYQLGQDNLTGLTTSVTVPASEIIHDRYNCLFHPLVGLSPIFANGVAATQSLNIQNNSANFFGNRSMPSGILVAPTAISDEDAARMKDAWQKSYSGENAGKIAVLGNNLKFESIATDAKDSQLIEQLQWSAQIVCSTYHVPPYKIGVGSLPSYNNVQALNVEYYSQALQRLIEDAELCLDEGLEMPTSSGTEFDLDNLLRMDSVTQMTVMKDAAGILEVDEIRAKLGYAPTEGGDTVYLQQQNFSLAALAKRDSLANPFALEPPVDQKIPTPQDEAAAAAAPSEPAKNYSAKHPRDLFSGRRTLMKAA